MRTPKSQKPKHFFKDLVSGFRSPRNKKASNSEEPVLDAQVSTPGSSSSNALTTAAPTILQPALLSPPSAAPTNTVVHVNAPSSDHDVAIVPVTQPPDNAIQEAIQKYVDELSDEDKTAFLSPADIMTRIQEFNKPDASIRLSGPLNARVARVIQGIKQFLTSVSIFTQQGPSFVSLAIGGANYIMTVCVLCPNDSRNEANTIPV